MNETHIRADIQRALSQFTDSELHENATQSPQGIGLRKSTHSPSRR